MCRVGYVPSLLCAELTRHRRGIYSEFHRLHRQGLFFFFFSFRILNFTIFEGLGEVAIFWGYCPSACIFVRGGGGRGGGGGGGGGREGVTFKPDYCFGSVKILGIFLGVVRIGVRAFY